MKGIMFVAQGQAAIVEEEMPACGLDTVLLRTLYSGVSLGTERMFLVGGNYGGNMPWPKRLAYQLVSEVVECGAEITRFAVGDVVFTGTFPGHVEYHHSVVFECSGGDVMDQIIGIPATHGLPGAPGLIGRRSRARVVMVAGRYDVTYNFNIAGNAEVDIVHTQHFDQEDLEEVVRLAARGDIRIRPLIRDVVPLSEAVRVFDALRDHPRQLLGTVFAVGDRTVTE